MTPRIRGDHGASLLEVLLVMGLLTTAATAAVPGAAAAIDSSRGRQAAAYVAGRLRAAQLHAVRTNRVAGLVFDATASGWQFRLCVDGNGNGLRRLDITAGVDQCLDAPADLERRFPGVSIAVTPTLPGPDGDSASADPVRFGATDIASFSPVGTGSSGSVFLRTGSDDHYLVRITGITGRMRTMRYRPGVGAWEPL